MSARARTAARAPTASPFTAAVAAPLAVARFLAMARFLVVARPLAVARFLAMARFLVVARPLAVARFLTVATLLAVAAPPPLAAQSLIGSRGLGIPLEALDGRSRALGSVGVGLFGGAVLPTDPARASRITVPSISITIQPTRGAAAFGDQSVPIEGTRFPLLAASYPVSGVGVATLSYGGLLEQNWKAERSLRLAQDHDSIDVADRYESDGSVGAARIGLARVLGGGVSVAANIGVHTGTQVRSFSRTIGVSEDEEQDPDDRFHQRGRWKMTGTTLGLGATWDFREFLRVSGSLSWSGDLRATPVGATEGGEARFELPTEFRVGASAMLTPVVAATFGFGRANWAPAESGAGAAARGAVTSYGGGIEWSGMDLFGRGFPVRVGYRSAGLPFSIDASTPTESGFAAGLGWNLIETETLVIAAFDFSYERGTRATDTVSESFSRYTFSFRASSF